MTDSPTQRAYQLGYRQGGNDMARLRADALDEADSARKDMQALQDLVSTLESDRIRLRERLLTFGVDDLAEQW